MLKPFTNYLTAKRQEIQDRINALPPDSPDLLKMLEVYDRLQAAALTEDLEEQLQSTPDPEGRNRLRRQFIQLSNHRERVNARLSREHLAQLRATHSRQAAPSRAQNPTPAAASTPTTAPAPTRISQASHARNQNSRPEAPSERPKFDQDAPTPQPKSENTLAKSHSNVHAGLSR